MPVPPWAKQNMATAASSPTPSSRPPPARKRARHPFLSGGLSGGLEIVITYPLEFIKNSLQTQPGRYAGPRDALVSNLRAHGPTVLYRGIPSWLLFAFPRSAIRFTVFDQTAAALDTQMGIAGEAGGAAAGGSARTGGDGGAARQRVVRDLLAGIVAGVVEAFTCLTPNQNLAIKLTHDANLPATQQRFTRVRHRRREAEKSREEPRRAEKSREEQRRAETRGDGFIPDVVCADRCCGNHQRREEGSHAAATVYDG